jgi:RNA polymerase sigma factor (sigma-70 family)
MTGIADISSDDRDLVAEFLRGRGEGAFRALYRRHSPYLFELVLRLAGRDLEDAHEVHQRAWVRAVSSLDGFRWQSSLRTWLTGIAVNCWRELQRGRARFVSFEEDGVPAGPEPARLNGDYHRLDLERAIARLPGGCREVLILHDLEGYTHAEIGGLLGIETGTSKSQLHRARRSVRMWLSEQKNTPKRMAGS